MHGNVWEWCEDFYAPQDKSDATDPQNTSAGTAHVLRGGAWCFEPQNCRSACRVWIEHRRRHYIGCRVCLCLE
jgi:sulfatase modifying factor 1